MPVRSEPFHKAEQTTQLLFGEKAIVLETNNREWMRIRCAWDGYEGWCKQSQLTEITNKLYKHSNKYICANHKGRIIFENSEMLLPLGSEPIGLKKGIIAVGNEQGIFKGKKLNKSKAAVTAANLENAALQYLNAPYLWGGRSLSGIDCSGLTQMAFKLCNQAIPRDAYQQAESGILVDFLQNSRCGDLAFFDDKDGRITHVGIILDNKSIIHAADSTGKVVIDSIDQGGIISRVMRKRTHNLRFVKRFIDNGAMVQRKWDF